MLAHSLKRIFINKGFFVPQINKTHPLPVFYNSTKGKSNYEMKRKNDACFLIGVEF